MLVRAQHGPIGQSVLAKLTAALAPSSIELENESHRHSVPPGSETHFKVVVVSDVFEGVPLVKRHRMVNEAVADLLAAGRGGGGVHALSIKARTPAQAAKGGATMQSTPGCKGGSKADDEAAARAAAAAADRG